MCGEGVWCVCGAKGKGVGEGQKKVKRGKGKGGRKGGVCEGRERQGKKGPRMCDTYVRYRQRDRESVRKAHTVSGKHKKKRQDSKEEREYRGWT